MQVHGAGGAGFAGTLERAIGEDDAQKQKSKRDQKHESGGQTQKLRRDRKHASDVQSQSRHQIRVLQGYDGCFESEAGTETCDDNHHGKSSSRSQMRH